MPTFAELARDLIYLQHGVIRLWIPFFEESGAVAADVGKYGNNGTISGASWVDGKIGKALSFDGINDYVVVGDSASLDIGESDLSIVAWVYLTASDSCVVSKRLGSGTYRGYLLYLDATKIRVQVNVDTYKEYSQAVPSLLNAWHHIGVSIDRDGINRMFLDGVIVKSFSAPEWIGDISNNVDLWIGQYHPSGGFFKGIIDEVRIYNRALSAEEILALYNATNI